MFRHSLPSFQNISWNKVCYKKIESFLHVLVINIYISLWNILVHSFRARVFFITWEVVLLNLNCVWLGISIRYICAASFYLIYFFMVSSDSCILYLFVAFDYWCWYLRTKYSYSVWILFVHFGCSRKETNVSSIVNCVFKWH